MTSYYYQYKEMTRKLLTIQNQYNDGSEEEEILLGQMDIMWYNMTEEEQNQMRKEA